MADPYAVGASIGAGFAAFLAGWSHIRNRRSSTVSERPPKIPHIEDRLNKLERTIEERDLRIQEQLGKIQRAIGRLEGRSESDP